MKELVKELGNLHGVSGYEDEIRAFIKKHIEAYADEMTVDNIGNLIAFKRGEKRRKRPVTVSGHMDEVGYLVMRIMDSGILKVSQVGGIDPRVVIGARMCVGPNKVKGVIALKARHLLTDAECDIAPKEWELSVDIGAIDKADAERMVSVGDQVTFDCVSMDLGKDCVKAKAIDARGVSAIMIEMIKEPHEFDTYYIFNSNEEILRGLWSLPRRLDPGACLILESAVAVDLPYMQQNMRGVRLRGGTAVSRMDLFTIYNRDFSDRMLKLADEQGIRWQYTAINAGGTDACYIHNGASGAIIFGLAVPTRYLHTGVSVACISDFEETLKFSKLFIKEAGECDV